VGSEVANHLLQMVCRGADLLQGPRLSVLIFHRVLSDPDPLFPGEMHAKRFEMLVHQLRSHCRVFTLGEAVTRMAAGTLPGRAVAITFDDGYADNFEIAVPILQRNELKATFFIASSFLNGGWMWNDVVIETIRRSPRSTIELDFLGLPPASSLAKGGRASRFGCGTDDE
jgi:Polysaccharide deacetylase